MTAGYKIRLAVIITVLFSAEISNSQDNIISPDSLLVSGIYDVFLIDGRQFRGEFLGFGTEVINFNADGDLISLKPTQIRIITIPDFQSIYNSDNDEYIIKKKKFRFWGIFNAGISMPIGAFDDIHKTGFGINATIYHFFDRLMGIGAEFQYNIFPGDIYTHSDSYSESRSESESYSIYSFKASLLVGNLRPEDHFIAYGLFGAGLQYYSDGSVSSTYSYYDPYYPYTYSFSSPDNSGISFLFGAGAGISYKISNKFRINGELQFNKLPRLDYNFFYDYDSNEFDGFFSIRVGLTYAL
jgi:opacity protein-like surface antigen